jgi:4-hydroxy-3-methylbut-2-enyl diphosphate reductase
MVKDVLDALRKLGPVQVSTMDGKEEHAEFRLPNELAEVPAVTI